MPASRRFFLASSAAVAGSLVLDGCRSLHAQPGPGSRTEKPPRSPLIDVHNHVFNSSDLPTVRFIKLVVIKNYPKQALRVLDITDADMLDGLVVVLTAMLGRARAPTARDEIRVLDRMARPVKRNAILAANEAEMIAAVAEIAAGGPMATESDTDSMRAIRSAIFKAAGETGIATSDAPTEPGQARRTAEKAYRSQFDLGIILRWFALFTRYRYVLSEQLVEDHARQGFDAKLLCPAITDFDSWLGESVDGSPLPDQVEVMGRLSRRRRGPVVHGYVGYDPLRQALYEAGVFRTFNPLELVARAIRHEGFIGVKIYPPMGFRPFGNSADVCQTYPDIKTIRDLMRAAGFEPQTAACRPRPGQGSVLVSKALDKAMAQLFDLCIAQDAAIVSHTNDSNAAAEGASGRADPAHWIGAFRRWPRLRVALAHFGSFNARSAAAPPGSKLPESSWEWTFGRYLAEAGDPPVFADISYFNEIFRRSPAELHEYARLFQRWMAEFDPECRHLMFGTDWTMLGLDSAYGGYTKGVYAFFERECSFTQAMLDRLYFGNAVRFLNIREGDAARTRLLAFYDRHAIPRARLPLFH